MADKNVNKVVINGVTVLDLSADSATADSVAQGKTFHDKSGKQKTGTLVNSAPNIQPLSVTGNGTYTAPNGVDGYSPVTVTVSGGGGGLPDVIAAGDTPVLLDTKTWYIEDNGNLQKSDLSLTIPRAGTYRFKWNLIGEYSNGTLHSKLYKNGIAVTSDITYKTPGSPDYIWSNIVSADVTCAAGDVIELYMQGYYRSGYHYGGCAGLTACIDWDNGF